MVVARRQRDPQLALGRLVPDPGGQSPLDQMQLRLGDRALEPQQEAIGIVGRVVDPVLSRRSTCRSARTRRSSWYHALLSRARRDTSVPRISPTFPSATSPASSRNPSRSATRDAVGGDPEIGVDHPHPLRRPAERDRPLDQLVLTLAALGVVAHLRRARLAHVRAGDPRQMLGRDLLTPPISPPRPRPRRCRSAAPATPAPARWRARATTPTPPPARRPRRPETSSSCTGGAARSRRARTRHRRATARPLRYQPQLAAPRRDPFIPTRGRVTRALAAAGIGLWRRDRHHAQALDPRNAPGRHTRTRTAALIAPQPWPAHGRSRVARSLLAPAGGAQRRGQLSGQPRRRRPPAGGAPRTANW